MKRQLAVLLPILVMAHFVSAEEPIRERIEWAERDSAVRLSATETSRSYGKPNEAFKAMLGSKSATDEDEE